MPRAHGVRGVLYLCIYFLLVSFFPAESKKQASLVTAWPGPEIYELCGHEAIRISGDGIDSVWNFGVFNFAEPNFVYRFVKGETDYMVASYPFALFMPEYRAQGRRVEEQVLNLSDEEVDNLHKLLRRVSTPPNNRYRYNYIKNNCSTRIATLLDSVGAGNIVYTDPIKFNTYREAMRAYHKNYPWYQFGIDVALGNGLEEELTQREELFIPVEFNRHAAKALLPDGRPLVKTTTVLYPGQDNATEGQTPFLLSPLWVSIVIAAISIILIAICWRRNRIPKWWYAFYFGVAGLAGCLLAFLVCVSSHAATSPNLLIFWLNPLQLIIPAVIWWRKMKYPIIAMMWLNVAVVGMLLVLMPFFDKGQAGQTAFIILMATDIILAAYYIKATSASGEIRASVRHAAGKKSSVNKSVVKKSPSNKTATRKGRYKNSNNSKIIIRETER